MTQGIKDKDIRDFEKYAHKLSEVMNRIRKYNPEANAYLANEDLNLMSCDFRQFKRSEQQQFIVTSVMMDAFDGGDW